MCARTAGPRRLGEALATYLRRRKDAGLASLPGTAAEILDDEIRAILCPDKIDTEQWLECHRQAHLLGLHSNITIMFGSVEQPRHWANHMLRTRALQRETGGFTEFVGLPFADMASQIHLQRAARLRADVSERVPDNGPAGMPDRGRHDTHHGEWARRRPV